MTKSVSEGYETKRGSGRRWETVQRP